MQPIQTMKHISLEEMKRLTGLAGEVCVSVYMPVEQATSTIDPPRIRFKNLLRQAEKAIAERSPKNKEIYARIEDGRRLMEDPDFWRPRSHGLAVFITPENFWVYQLPIPFEEAFWISNRPAVKPLIPMFMSDGRFYILALSQSQIRLFSCTRFHVMEIDLMDVPAGISASLQYDSKHYQIQFHTGTAAGAGDRPAMYHGQGAGIDDRKDEILRYFQDVDRGLSSILSEGTVPLVLAGVDYLLPIFREALSYRWVMDAVVTGNPENLRAEELHEKALAIVNTALEKKQREAEARYREVAGKGYTAAGIRSVLPAAAYGRVDTLFVASGERLPGTFDREKNEVVLAEEGAANGAEDLLDLAVVETIRGGGDVYVLEKERMPEQHAEAAAILRY